MVVSVIGWAGSAEERRCSDGPKIEIGVVAAIAARGLKIEKK